MTIRPLLAAAATAALLTGATACSTIAQLPTERLGSATLSLANGVPSGTAQLLSTGTGVSLAVAVTGLTPGAHGFHLHTTGRCEAPAFESAGGHLNPDGRNHGTQSPGGAHLGDLPNLQVGANGSASATFDIDGPRADVLRDIFDSDGTAVLVHASADDYRTDPSGDAGARVACGVMRPAG